MNVLQFQTMKEAGEKIVMVTCYDYTSACIVEDSQVHCVLVGDSLAMVMHGHDDTTKATMPMMQMHTQAVARGLRSKFIVADLPFMSYRKSLHDTMTHVQSLVQAGCHAVKLEGCSGNLETIRHIVDSGVPVMGHLGLTPQSVHALGGHRIQGKSEQLATTIHQQALALQQAGCFAIVLECIPAKLATTISHDLKIPSIGIGAGPGTDGQVLVWQDLLGLQDSVQPKFLKTFLAGKTLSCDALNKYAREVSTQAYPALNEHTY